MKNKFAGGFRKLSLTQQVMVLILLMLGFLTVFFFFFLTDNISSTINREIYSMMASRQEPVIQALQAGRNESEDRELFEYMTNDSFQTVGTITSRGQTVISQGRTSYNPAFEACIEDLSKPLLQSPHPESIEGSVEFDGEQMYYLITKVPTLEGDVIVYSYMDNTYGQDVRRTLLDSTIYVTILAFFLILMIFVFWVFSIIHPLNQIKAYITQIKQGKDVDLYINRDDEIGEVAKELRTLTSELAKQEKAKEEMIHNISHDLKTPIATIKSYSESIKDGIYPYGDLESSVDVILANAKRLEDKVHNLLYMNRVEYLVSSDASGVVTDMKDVVEQVVLNAAVVKPEIEIQTDVEEVFFDGLLEGWRVCIENIMENAFRYAKSYIRIYVRDNELVISNDGPKMPEDRIESLFKPYIKGEGGKFGLGLSIVSKIVAANNYKVEGLNTEDGVAFRIYRDVPEKKARKSYTANVHWNAAGRNVQKTSSKSAQNKGRENGADQKENENSRQNAKNRKNASKSAHSRFDGKNVRLAKNEWQSPKSADQDQKHLKNSDTEKNSANEISSPDQPDGKEFPYYRNSEKEDHLD